MRRYLLAALWPAGMAAIAAATVIAARRGPASPARTAPGEPPRQGGPEPAGPALQGGPDGGSRLAAVTGAEGPGGSGDARLPDWVPGLIKLGAASVVCGAFG